MLQQDQGATYGHPGGLPSADSIETNAGMRGNLKEKSWLEDRGFEVKAPNLVCSNFRFSLRYLQDWTRVSDFMDPQRGFPRMPQAHKTGPPSPIFLELREYLREDLILLHTKFGTSTSNPLLSRLPNLLYGGFFCSFLETT